MKRRALLWRRTHVWPGACVVFLALFGSQAFILADGPIFKYEDDSGIATFTEQWDSIPTKYRGQVVTLNAQTLKPIEGGSSRHIREASQPSTRQPVTNSPGPSWQDRLYALPMPLPSQFQLGVGVTSGVLILGIILARRYTANPVLKVFLKLGIVILLGGTGYVLYFSTLNTELSTLSREPLHQTTTVGRAMQNMKTTTAPISDAIQQGVVQPIQAVIKASKDATTEQAARTVDQANASTRQLEHTLKESDVEQAHAEGH